MLELLCREQLVSVVFLTSWVIVISPSDKKRGFSCMGYAFCTVQMLVIHPGAHSYCCRILETEEIKITMRRFWGLCSLIWTIKCHKFAFGSTLPLLPTPFLLSNNLFRSQNSRQRNRYSNSLFHFLFLLRSSVKYWVLF